jgi:hypothetical protein
MNFAKYFFTFLFALSLTVVTVGCGESEVDPASDEETMGEDDDPTMDDDSDEADTDAE